MTYDSFKTFKMKLLKLYSNEIIECNLKITEYTVDLHFPEYNIPSKRYEVNGDKFNVKKFLKNTNCMLINIIFIEIIKIKNSLFNVTKIKLSHNEKLINSLSSKIKEIHCTLLEFNC